MHSGSSPSSRASVPGNALPHSLTLRSAAGKLVHPMEWEFLYDRARHLLAIGYNVSEGRRDESYYDLLASEARLG